MKTKKFELLLGGAQPQKLSPDAMMGLHSLSRSISEKTAEDELFETAIRRANEEELRKLARFRLDSAASKYLD
ncbi:hypothetical protein [Pelagicoccus mobilis]|uniref:Uncharacterized protein n=1 Tax=Pelagicoccus mobilis TaxID=415221 RepID=A0A934S4T9_9BACT|nr:hypothetical protein [Pelagicoccus mobilis]MBK1879384.1 hypothetical protein [Pelagicoccus mobilis]